jgi:hypothetical protein
MSIGTTGMGIEEKKQFYITAFKDCMDDGFDTYEKIKEARPELFAECEKSKLDRSIIHWALFWARTYMRDS